MELHKPSFANRAGKALSKPLSKISCSSFFYKTARMVDAYLNFLLGKSSGTGWNMEEEVHAAVKRVYHAKQVIFDVGANIGNWSQSFFEAVPEAKIYLFDPSPGCQEAIREKELPGIILFPFALGKIAETKTYFSSSPTDGSASLHSRRDTPFQKLTYQSSVVEVRTLDELIESEKIDCVDFMKMDIEGHELFALRGAKRSLAAGKIRALSFEFGCGNINSRTFFCDFWELLPEANFSIYRITPSGKDILVGDYYEDDEYFRGATNFAAELKSR